MNEGPRKITDHLGDLIRVPILWLPRIHSSNSSTSLLLLGRLGLLSPILILILVSVSIRIIVGLSFGR